MPAVNFYIRWPDGKEEQCYSPSTVIYQAFKPGDSMPLSEFMQKAEAALEQASERVKASYGYYCSSAADQSGQLQRRASEYDDHSQLITILSMSDIAR
ncbi:MSMEG_0570 family nitrogen starvation response protein [Oceanobacter mangrovi]|uniref:MSMEG_0570 family nitrogen starvation response protein n=1 Tax=Oceanobacter mangrovi TaxID=2862510 RepID=UPI001C8D9F34|nr:MSMEG_0570 family nitrogen starvation response protein [Oceanobacter mangrovi]